MSHAGRRGPLTLWWRAHGADGHVQQPIRMGAGSAVPLRAAVGLARLDIRVTLRSSWKEPKVSNRGFRFL